MDRNLLRKMAKQEYKKMMKGLKRSQRPSFAQAWPLIKSTLEGKMRDTPVQDQLTVDDAAALDQMLIGAEPEAEHVHGPDCNHEHEVVKVDI